VTLPLTVPPGSTATFNVSFAPSVAGVLTGTLSIFSNNATNPFIVNLTGTGVETNGFLPLVTEGNQLKTTSGTPVRLKSVNWFGAETTVFVPHGLWQVSYTSILDQIVSMGFNCIRLPFAGTLMTNPMPGGYIHPVYNADLVGLTALEVLDVIIDAAASRGLRVMLDMHSKQGEYLDGQPTNTTWTYSDWLASWQFMANRYNSKPNIIGADVYNEPHTLTWTAWQGYCESIGNAIHAIAPHWLIVVEGVGNVDGGTAWAGGNLRGVATDPVTLTIPNRVVYSPHEYGQSVYVMDWLQTPSHVVSGWPNNLYAIWQERWGYIFENNVAPIFIGEYGGYFGIDGYGVFNKPYQTEEQQWLANLVKYLNGDFDGNGTTNLTNGKLGMSHTYWCINPNSSDTGGLLQEDWVTQQTHKLGLIAPLLA
jgi:endoglucanase